MAVRRNNNNNNSQAPDESPNTPAPESQATDCPEVLPIGGTGEVDEGALQDDTSAEITPRQRSAGKIKIILNDENYQHLPAEMAKQGVTPFVHRTNNTYLQSAQQWKNYQTSLADRFRYVSMTFWGSTDFFAEDEKIEEGTFQYINSGVFMRANRDKKVDGVPYKITAISEPVQDLGPGQFGLNDDLLIDFYKRQTITITANQEAFGRPVPIDETNQSHPGEFYPEFFQSFWGNFVRGESLGPAFEGVVPQGSRSFPALFNEATLFYDHTFRLTAPMFPKEIERINGLPKPSIAKFDMEYNFYVKEYEAALRKILSHDSLESLLPNMYVFLSELKSPNLNSDQSIFWRLITLNNIIKGVFRDIMDGDRKVGEEDRGQYFDKWGRAYEDLRASLFVRQSPGLRSLQAKYKKLILSPLDMGHFQNFNKKRNLFPMYVDIQFSTDRTTLLAESIKAAQLGTSLIQAVTQKSRESDEDPRYLPDVRRYRIATETVSSSINKPDKIVTLSEPRQRKVLDLIEWWRAFQDRQIETQDTSVILGSSLPEVFASQDQQYRFIQTILSLVFSGKLRNILKGRLRTFEDVMNGKYAYSETIFYKISKYQINETTGETGTLLQEIFVPNSNEVDIFRYIDTQVIFNKKYRYIIYAYEMVFGTKYIYAQLPAPFRGPQAFVVGSQALVDVYTGPSIQLIEIPFFKFDTQIADKPPLPPQVDLIPYRGVSDEILINFSSNTGELKAQPIVFSAEEATKVRELRAIHDLASGAPIDYKGDDPVATFEVYRITSKPGGFWDFLGGLHREVSTELLATRSNSQSIPALSSASIIDSIRPNVKYYYLFRAVDIHGNVSNPSSVFRVEMVYESGLSYPVIETYDFEPERKFNSRSFKKYIHIGPAVIQDDLNIINGSEIESANDARVELGSPALSERLFAAYPQKKKIKIRLTSKQTGKKMDINLHFTHKHET